MVLSPFEYPFGWNDDMSMYEVGINMHSCKCFWNTLSKKWYWTWLNKMLTGEEYEDINFHDESDAEDDEKEFEYNDEWYQYFWYVL